MAELLGQELIKELLALFFVFFCFLCGVIWKTFSNYLKQKSEHDIKVDEKLDKLDTKIDAKFEEVSNQVKKFKEDSDATDRAILRGEILDRMERVKDQKCVSHEYYEVTKDMYDEYKAKNGNGVVDKEWVPFENKALCSE